MALIEINKDVTIEPQKDGGHKLRFADGKYLQQDGRDVLLENISDMNRAKLAAEKYGERDVLVVMKDITITMEKDTFGKIATDVLHDVRDFTTSEKRTTRFDGARRIGFGANIENEDYPYRFEFAVPQGIRANIVDKDGKTMLDIGDMTQIDELNKRISAFREQGPPVRLTASEEKREAFIVSGNRLGLPNHLIDHEVTRREDNARGLAIAEALKKLDIGITSTNGVIDLYDKKGTTVHEGKIVTREQEGISLSMNEISRMSQTSLAGTNWDPATQKQHEETRQRVRDALGGKDATASEINKAVALFQQETGKNIRIADVDALVTVINGGKLPQGPKQR